LKSIRLNLDAWGMCASILCMVHCLAFPLLLAALPLWKFGADDAPPSSDSPVSSATLSSLASAQSPLHCTDPECCAKAATHGGRASGMDQAACCSTPTDFWIHIGLLAAVAPLGIVAWGAGYRRHRQAGVLALGILGVLLLSGALLFGHQWLKGRGEQVMTVAGSLCMVTAHLSNRRQCRCCKAPDFARLAEIETTSHACQQLPVIS